MTKEDELVDFIKESLNEKALYDLINDFYESYGFFPNSEDKHDQKCMYCFKHTTVSSHSISKNQLETFASGADKPLYRLTNKNQLKILHELILLIIKDIKKKDNFESTNFTKVLCRTASTFSGFCDQNGNNHETELFKNIDGHNGLKNKNELIWEILYRTIAWKIRKFEVEIELKENKIFKQFWEDLLNLNNFQYKRSHEEYIKIMEYNIQQLKSILKDLRKLRKRNKIYKIKNKYEFYYEEIENPEFMGINYFIDYFGENIKIIEEIKSPLCCGLIKLDKYIAFIISNKSITKKKICKDSTILETIKPLLLIEEPENTYTNTVNKKKINQYLINYKG